MNTRDPNPNPLPAEPVLGPVSRTGIPVPTSVDASAVNPERIGKPGEYPFTRGIFPDGYQGRLWTIRQYSGFGTAEESNERYKFLLDQGQTGLSVALDLPTQCGLDPTHPMAKPEIGKVGVSLSNLSEAEILFKDLDLGKISTSFTINGTAAIIYAMYLAVADKQGVPRSKLTGTIQNDILKEYVARGTWIFPVRPSMRLIADSILYSNDVTPRFNPISIAGAHVRDAGATAAEEMAYTLANGLAYVDELQRRGGDVEKFAKRLSFFFYVHMDFFDEIAKFRAGRRLWARFMKERYAVQDPKAQHFRFGVVCGGSSLVAPQPYNNAVRVAVETMAAVFGGAQSIFTCAFDEAFQIPTEFSAELAVRTQQMIAFEIGHRPHGRPARRQLLPGAAHRPHGGNDRQGDGRDRRLRRRGPGHRGRLDPAAAGRTRPGAQARHRFGQGAHRRPELLPQGRREDRRRRRLQARPDGGPARAGEIREGAGHAQPDGGRCLARQARRGRGQGQRERDALPGGVLPRLRHGGGDGGLPEEGMGRIQGTGESMNETKTARPLAGKRILVGKPGLDGHDIGAKIVALTLRDAGAEVIYTGLRRSPAQIAQVAVDEGVDAVGLSILSGSHKELVKDVIAELRERRANGIKVFVGGTIPGEDHAELRDLGVSAVFTADMLLDERGARNWRRH